MRVNMSVHVGWSLPIKVILYWFRVTNILDRGVINIPTIDYACSSELAYRLHVQTCPQSQSTTLRFQCKVELTLNANSHIVLYIFMNLHKHVFSSRHIRIWQLAHSLYLPICRGWAASCRGSPHSRPETCSRHRPPLTQTPSLRAPHTTISMLSFVCDSWTAWECSCIYWVSRFLK